MINTNVQTNTPLKPTACVLCSMNCGLNVSVEDNKINKVEADKENPITQGHICNKAFSIDKYVNHKQRLKAPLKKDAKGIQQVAKWGDVLPEIGQRLKAIKEQYGGDKIAIAGLGGQANHSDVLYGLSLLKSFNSHWFFSAYAQEKTQHHMIERWMFDSPPHSMIHPDPWKSDVLIIIGCNPLHSNRGYKTAENLRAFKKADKQLFVIDPRLCETARKADVHIAHRPGSDVWLLTAMVAMVVQNNWQDKEYMSQWVIGGAELVEHFNDIDIAEQCAKADVDVEAVLAMTKAYAQADKGSLFWDTGIEWIPHTSIVSWLLRVLLVITGNYGREGGNALRPGFMADGHLLEAKEPYVAPASGIRGIPALGPFDMFSPNLLVDEINAGHVRALIVCGANPLRSYANTAEMKKAFEKLDLLVVMDTSHTETAMAADYVLATPGGYEKYEWSTFGRKFPNLTVHLRPPVVKPTGDLKVEAEIFNQLLHHSGGPAKAPKWLKRLGKKGWENKLIGPAIIVSGMIAAKGNPVKAFVRWVNWAYDVVGDSLPAKHTASLWLTCQLVAFTRYRQFKTLPGLESPTRNPFILGTKWFRQILDNPNGTIMATLPWDWHLKQALGHKDKKIQLLPKPLLTIFKRVVNESFQTTDEFPMWLSAGERSPGTANTIMRDPSWRKGRTSRCLLKINPEEASKLGLENDDWVELITSAGQAKLQVILDSAMRHDNVSIPNGLGLLYPDDEGELKPFGINPNDLTDYRWRDELTGIPAHKTVPCRLVKCEE
ncbi:MAG: molybdopterin-dependent oxidoreductase [Oleispira sp.]